MASQIATIPKKVSGGEELVVIPRKEYERFVEWEGFIKTFKIFTPTTAQKRALRNAERHLREGKTLSIDELRKKLGFTN